MAGVTGLLADVAYVLTAAVPLCDIARPRRRKPLRPLIACASVALNLLLAAERATLAGLLAAVANVAAGTLVTAMLLVQISVDDVEAGLSPAVNKTFEHVEFGLDLSWDVFLVAGTILFGCAMAAVTRFGLRFGPARDRRWSCALRAQVRVVPDAGFVDRTSGRSSVCGARSCRSRRCAFGAWPDAASAATSADRRRPARAACPHLSELCLAVPKSPAPRLVLRRPAADTRAVLYSFCERSV